jgi:U3 small nucleolar ribonucleoprotein protein LCP5
MELINRIANHDVSLDTVAGLSLLLARPQILLETLHQLVILTAIRLSSDKDRQPTPASAYVQEARREDIPIGEVEDALAGEILLNQEMMERIRGLETKIEYQIRKLVGLAEAEESRGNVVLEEAEDGKFIA